MSKISKISINMKTKHARLAVLLTHPVQYFKPVFKALAASKEVEIKVFFGCNHGVISSHDPDFGVSFAWDSSPTEGFNHCFLSEYSLVNLSKPATAISLALHGCSQIRSWKPDAVLIFAYSPLFITLSTLLLALKGATLLLRADGTDRAFKRSPWKSWLKDQLLHRYYRLFSQIFPIGSDSNDHFARLGVPKQRRQAVPFAVDVSFFEEQIQHWLPKQHQLRAELQIPISAEVLLMVGKITEVKAPLLLVDALAQLPAKRLKQLWLIVVGDGPLKNAMADALKTVLPNRHLFVGFQNQSQLGRFYAVADSLVFTSVQGETWGLVVNEVLQFGLRVVSSDHPGCARDLLRKSPHQIFPSGEAKALTKILSEPWRKLFINTIPTACDLPHPNQLANAVINYLLNLN